MPTPKKGARLGGSAAHQKLIIANLATSLFEHGRITTTEAKARVLRPVAEKLITKAKKGDLHNRRQVLATIRDKGVVHALFEEIGPRYAERPGGYTRITKIGPRKGDNAPMAVIELVTEDYAPEGALHAVHPDHRRPGHRDPGRRGSGRVEVDRPTRGFDETRARRPYEGSTPARGESQAPEGPDQGQRGLQEVPRSPTASGRADRRRGAVRHARGRRGGRLHQGRRSDAHAATARRPSGGGGPFCAQSGQARSTRPVASGRVRPARRAAATYAVGQPVVEAVGQRADPTKVPRRPA